MGADVAQLRSLSAEMVSKATLVETQAIQIVAEHGLSLQALAQMNAPVDTGFLRGSIGIDGTGSLTVEIGPTAEYAPYLEDGTYKMAARPFMGPAADVVEPRFVTALEALGATL